jgi:hypothetical protein
MNQDPRARLDELRALQAELEALGEPPDDALEAALAQAQALAAIHAAADQGADALAALPEAPAPDLASLQALHRLRGAAGQDTLTPDRADALWGQLQAQLSPPGARVIPLRRRVTPAWAWMAAAAALLAVVAAAWWAAPRPSSPAVAQVELERAQARHHALQADALRALMDPARPAPPSGDHALRDLRQSGFALSRARAQARARRL